MFLLERGPLLDGVTLVVLDYISSPSHCTFLFLCLYPLHFAVL